jgi:exopolysaccharide/PEP-CTERM locus tyrosine autokinase
MSKIEEALEKADKLRQRQLVDEEVLSSASEYTEHFSARNEFIITPEKSELPVAEEYRRLKSILIRQTKSDFKNLIMITSAVEGEGKTITSINLAIAFAREIDHSVLLLDADLRNPMIDKYLGLECPHGLYDYLTSSMNISDVIYKTDLPHLKILPAGKKTDRAAELLASNKMKTLMQDLKKKFMDRYIIVDTPPVETFADAIILGSYVDAVLMVIKERGVKQKTIQEALDQLKSFNLLGVVYNHASTSVLNGRYSKYQGYSYGG